MRSILPGLDEGRSPSLPSLSDLSRTASTRVKSFPSIDTAIEKLHVKSMHPLKPKKLFPFINLNNQLMDFDGKLFSDLAGFRNSRESQ